MRKLYVFLFICFATAYRCAFCQQHTVKGIVLNSSNKPVDFMTVALLKDSILVQSAFTDSLGVFSIKTEKGDYHLALRQFGKELLKKELSVSNDLDLGTLIVIQAILLDGVTIEGRKKLIEQKVDRLIFNVGESVVTVGGTALDALKATPRIQVINERIGIVGKGSAVIMIDDRPVPLIGEELANFLKSLSADDIQRIEVIPTPPAKYNAEGNSGLVNIILKKAVLNSLKNTIRASYIQATHPSYNIGNTFNYKKDNLSIYASLNGETGRISTIGKYQIYYPEQKWDYHGSHKIAQDFYAGRVNTDYQISKNSNVGIILFYNKTFPNKDEKSNIDVFDNYRNPTGNIRTKSALNETGKDISLNAHFNHSFDTIGRNVVVNADYFNYSQNKDMRFDTRQYDKGNNELHRLIADNNGAIDIRNFALGIDFEHPFKWGSLSYGGKIIFTNTKSNISLTDQTTGIPFVDPQQTDNFKYQENVQALYADFSKK